MSELDIENEVGGGEFHEKIVAMVELYCSGKLTKRMVRNFFSSIPQDRSDDALSELEDAISDEVENLPD